MNWYRNAYFHESNFVKQQFKDIIEEKLLWIKIPEPYGLEMVLYYKRNCDLDNFDAIISKFLNDALKEIGSISDDNVNVFQYKSCRVWGKDTENPRMEINIIKL